MVRGHLGLSDMDTAYTIVHALARSRGIGILSGKNFEEIVSFRSGSFGFGSNANCGAFLVTQEVGGQEAQDCHVLRRVASATAAVMHAKGDVEDPADRIFDAPVDARGSQKQFGIGRQAGDEASSLKRGVVWQLPFRCGAQIAMRLSSDNREIIEDDDRPSRQLIQSISVALLW